MLLIRLLKIKWLIYLEISKDYKNIEKILKWYIDFQAYFILRLKHQLLFEHQDNITEYNAWNKTKVQEDIKTRHDRLIARKADREHERKKFVEQKNMQKLL